MVDCIEAKSGDVETLKCEVTDFITSNGDDETIEIDELHQKLKLVEEEYTIILKCVSFFYVEYILL